MDHLECPATVVVHQVFDVLQEERPGAVILDNAGNIEEKSSLSIAAKTVWPVKRILFETPAMENG